MWIFSAFVVVTAIKVPKVGRTNLCKDGRAKYGTFRPLGVFLFPFFPFLKVGTPTSKIEPPPLR